MANGVNVSIVRSLILAAIASWGTITVMERKLWGLV